jgi:hypothetical protein
MRCGCSVTLESEIDMKRMAAKNVQLGLDGAAPPTLVNPEVLHSRSLRIRNLAALTGKPTGP